MGQNYNTRDLRRIYFSEVKNDAFRRIGKTIFVLLFGVLSMILADAATHPDTDPKAPNFRR